MHKNLIYTEGLQAAATTSSTPTDRLPSALLTTINHLAWLVVDSPSSSSDDPSCFSFSFWVQGEAAAAASAAAVFFELKLDH